MEDTLSKSGDAVGCSIQPPKNLVSQPVDRSSPGGLKGRAEIQGGSIEGVACEPLVPLHSLSLGPNRDTP